MSSLDSYPMSLFLLYIIIMITLILFVLANVIAIAMHQFKDDQKAVLMLAWAFCFILLFVSVEYFTGVML